MFEEHTGDEGTINEAFLKALRRDPTWADTYVMTGCLKLPELEVSDGEHGEIISRVQKVNSKYPFLNIVFKELSVPSRK